MTRRATIEDLEQYAQATSNGTHAWDAALSKAGPQSESYTVVGVDRGFEPSVSSVHYRCGRCKTMFTGENSSHINAQLAAHQERCFVAGDWVRWEPIKGCMWIEGTIDRLDRDSAYVRVAANGDCPDWSFRAVGALPSLSTGNIRRIPRPGQEVCDGTWTHGAELLHHCSQPADHEGNCYDSPPLRSEPLYVASPAPTLYDGLTAEQCLYKFQLRQRDNPKRLAFDRRTANPCDVFDPLSPVISIAQLNIARFLWSTRLAAKVAETQERERCQVVLEQDAEDFEW